MNSLKRITFNPFVLSLALFLLVHALLLNINKAEWGDSYRILRATEFVRHYSYPSDEKRPPLFSALLAVRPNNVDPIFSARIFMFGLSAISFVLFFSLLKRFVTNKTTQLFILLLYLFNPVYLYWSIRVYADLLFSVFVMLVFWMVLWIKDRPLLYKYMLLGFVLGLSVITRFEGYILTFSLGLFLLYDEYVTGEKKLVSVFRLSSLKRYILVAISFLIVVLPYVLYKNPFTSSYLAEPSGRTYDLKMIWTYVISLLYAFGFTSAFHFIFLRGHEVYDYLKKYVFVLIFMVLDLVLILLWPAAIPRLFMPLIPFLMILLGISMDSFKTNIRSYRNIIIPTLLLIFYVFSQFFIKGQFLIVNKPVFVLVVILQLFSIIALYINKMRLFQVLTLFSAIIWTLITIYMHRDIYQTTKEAALFADSGNPEIIHNDINSVIEWYAGDNAFFCDKDLKDVQTCITKYDAKIVIYTNDSNPSYKFNSGKYPYLKLIRNFSYEVNGAIFDAEVYAVDKGKML